MIDELETWNLTYSILHKHYINKGRRLSHFEMTVYSFLSDSEQPTTLDYR
jgi:hypothetical protein